MINVERSENEWLTLQDAAVITGRSVTSLRMLIKRNKIEQVRKIPGQRGEKWVIKKEALKTISNHEGNFDNRDQRERSKDEKVISLPIEIYTQQQKEHDQLVQGLAMYRYKFEEADKQLRLLPAPPEYIRAKIEELEKNLQEEARKKEENLYELRAKLEEEEKVKANIRAEMERLMSELESEKKRSWWKKLLGLK